MFRSLGFFNYRVWFIGALASNIGTWMQRTAQDWLVLTELTDYDAAAVGFSMALQFAPQLLLLPITGLIADRLDTRKALMATQAGGLLLAVGLGLLVLIGHVELWHVYAFAFGLGIVSAVDAPIRQTFVAELVATKDLQNAVSLNSVNFHTARLIGPAVAGFLVVVIGTGWVFILNSGTFVATLIALGVMRRSELRLQPKMRHVKGQMMGGVRYVRGRPDIILIFIMVFLIGTFGMNFAIYSSTMTTVEFGLGAGEFGLLSSIMAIGSVTGALLAARRSRPRLRTIALAAGAFSLSVGVAALMPTYELFALALAPVGASALTFMTTANAFVQTTVEPSVRGRVMALYMAIFMGGTPIGAPLVGWVVNIAGPRWGLGVAVLAGGLAFLAAATWLLGYRRARFVKATHGIRIAYGRKPSPRELATQEIAITEAEVQKS